MKNLIAIALLALPLAASAQEGPMITFNPLPLNGIASPAVNTYDLYVASDGLHSSRIFGLMPGGCMRGPLVFWNYEGREILRLEAGAEFGSGCSPSILSVAPIKPGQ